MPDLKQALVLMGRSNVASEEELKAWLETHVPDYLPVMRIDPHLVATRIDPHLFATRTRWQGRLLGLLLRRAGKVSVQEPHNVERARR